MEGEQVEFALEHIEHLFGLLVQVRPHVEAGGNLGLERRPDLAALGLGGTPRHITQPTPNGPITIATVRDPDGILVLLTPGSITRRA